MDMFDHILSSRIKTMREYDLIIIGGGASGLLSAINGKKME